MMIVRKWTPYKLLVSPWRKLLTPHACAIASALKLDCPPCSFSVTFETLWSGVWGLWISSASVGLNICTIKIQSSSLLRPPVSPILIRSFPEQVKLLQQLPVPAKTTLSPSSSSSLYDWISTHVSDDTIHVYSVLIRLPFGFALVHNSHVTVPNTVEEQLRKKMFSQSSKLIWIPLESAYCGNTSDYLNSV